MGFLIVRCLAIKKINLAHYTRDGSHNGHIERLDLSSLTRSLASRSRILGQIDPKFSTLKNNALFLSTGSLSTPVVSGRRHDALKTQTAVDQNEYYIFFTRGMEGLVTNLYIK